MRNWALFFGHTVPSEYPGTSWYIIKLPSSKPLNLATSHTFDHSSSGRLSHHSPLVLHGTLEKNQAPGPLTLQYHPQLCTPPRAHTPVDTRWSSGSHPMSQLTSRSQAPIWDTISVREMLQRTPIVALCSWPSRKYLENPCEMLQYVLQLCCTSHLVQSAPHLRLQTPSAAFKHLSSG